MLLFLRTFFTVGFFYCLHLGAKDAESSDPGTLFMMVPTLLMALLAGLTWAPYLGEKVAAPFTLILTAGSEYVEEEAWLVKFMQWAESRGHRRWVLFGCILQSMDRPSMPTAYRVGLNHVKKGSWLERHFAIRLYEFGNAQNALRAYKIMVEHGLRPPPHASPEVAMLIQSSEVKLAVDRPPIPIPSANPVANLKRDSRIELFEADPPASGGNA